MSKWQNISAGPRQAKDFNKAISALRGEGKTRTEVTGVIGGESREWHTMSLMGAVRAEVVALEDAIVAKYDGKVTSTNVRQIIADLEAALPEARTSRPVEDNRITPEESDERDAKAAARAAAEKAERDERNAVLNAVMARKPAGATRLIYAEYNVDKSDPMTDYFASHSVRTVAIGWGFTKVENFPALRAAARQFAETAEIDFSEHRDNYSMGAGNYLSDHGWAGSGTGWLVKSRKLPCTWLSITEDAIPEHAATPAAVPAASAGDVTVRPSSIGREGVVEVVFTAKPAAEVLTGLKSHGFRWAKSNRCWYGRDVAYAQSLLPAMAEAS